MKTMSLSQVCELYGFTRRVIQVYEKEGLIKHTGKNKYGHLLYDEQSIKRIAYIRYLQINGYKLNEILSHSQSLENTEILNVLLKNANEKLKNSIKKKEGLIETNNSILSICNEDDIRNKKEERIMNILMEEIKNGKTI